jgi:hypothetical protein
MMTIYAPYVFYRIAQIFIIWDDEVGAYQECLNDLNWFFSYCLDLVLRKIYSQQQQPVTTNYFLAPSFPVSTQTEMGSSLLLFLKEKEPTLDDGKTLLHRQFY